MGALMLLNQAKAIAAAQKAIAEFDLSDVAYCVQEIMNLSDYNEIHTAVDPKYVANKERQRELYNTIRSNLTSEEARSALPKYADSMSDECVVRETAWFYLGYVTAMKIQSFGKQQT